MVTAKDYSWLEPQEAEEPTVKKELETIDIDDSEPQPTAVNSCSQDT